MILTVDLSRSIFIIMNFTILKLISMHRINKLSRVINKCSIHRIQETIADYLDTFVFPLYFLQNILKLSILIVKRIRFFALLPVPTVFSDIKSCTNSFLRSTLPHIYRILGGILLCHTMHESFLQPPTIY